MSRCEVAVVGGGFAGISAAVRMAETGHRPTLLERRPVLGGRAYSFRHDPSSDTVDNGQHVLMRCCTEVRSLLELIGSDHLHFQSGFDIPFVDTDGQRHRLRAPRWLPPSLGLFAAFLRFGPAGIGDALGLRRILPYFSHPPERISVAEWLDQAAQSDAIRRVFWHPLCRSVMNAPPDLAPASDLVAVLAEAFSTRSGADMGWSTVGLSTLYTEQARQHIESRSGRVRTGAFLTGIEPLESGYRLSLRDGDVLEADALVLAVPPPRAAELLEPFGQETLIGRLRAYVPSPILGINLWFDREVMQEPFIGILDGTVEWVFDKRHVFGEGSRDKGSHLSLVVSASEELLERSDEDLAQTGLDDLRRTGLIHMDEEPTDSLVVHEKRATYLRPVDAQAVPTDSGAPGLFLAGDWTDTGLPPTIEGAVRSGSSAASSVSNYLKTERPEPKPRS